MLCLTDKICKDKGLLNLKNSDFYIKKNFQTFAYLNYIIILTIHY